MQFYPTTGFHPFGRSNDDLTVLQNRHGFLHGRDHPIDCLFPWDQTLDHKARPNLDPDKQYSANLWSRRIARVRVLQTLVVAPHRYIQSRLLCGGHPRLGLRIESFVLGCR